MCPIMQWHVQDTVWYDIVVLVTRVRKIDNVSDWSTLSDKSPFTMIC